MFSLTHKVAVVTGSASGIGEAVVQRFLKAGATVYSLDLVEAAVAGATALVGKATLHRTLEVNVHGVTYGVKHGPRFMPESEGRLINTTSFVGIIGIPLGSAYAVSKAAVVQITKCAAIELAARRITVNAVAPGTVLTPAVTDIPNNPEIPFVSQRTPLGQLTKSEEMASAFHFLANACSICSAHGAPTGIV